MLRLATTTLGCKVNRADADALIAALADEPWIVAVPFDSEADLYIINTCTVTATADRQSRQLVYRARRRNPRSKIVLTGCLARVDRARAEGILGVDRVFTLAEHGALADYVRAAASAVCRFDGVERLASAAETVVERRARPFLKIQDGCDSRCSYCVVPRARGASRSDPPLTVRRAAEALARAGHAEIVLTGIHLGLYGRDLDPPTSLAALLEDLTGIGARLRLSSVEPMELDEQLVGQIATRADLCPHLHVPLQSGASEILVAMNRPYDGDRALELLAWLRRRLPRAALGTDLITGFPGETPSQHERSLRLVEESPLTHLHVFPFSPRPGTTAAALPERIGDSELRRRAAELREAGRRKLVAFAASQIGTISEVLVERACDGILAGLTEHYLRVEARGAAVMGRIARMEIEAAAGPVLRGRLLDPS